MALKTERLMRRVAIQSRTIKDRIAIERFYLRLFRDYGLQAAQYVAWLNASYHRI